MSSLICPPRSSLIETNDWCMVGRPTQKNFFRGRPVMIWGAEEISEMNLFFPGNPFRIKIFSSARPHKIYFFLGKGSQIFFLESASQNLFFPG